MKLLKKFAVPAVLIIFWLQGCISVKELEYMQPDLSSTEPTVLSGPVVQKIKIDDELYIRVSSFDEVAFNFFGNQSDMRSQVNGTEVSVSLVSYIVDESGYIHFPILEKVHVEGLTIEEATTQLKSMLSDYFNQPTVLIKFVNKRITVLGEVRRPGQFIYTNNNVNIFEALGLAGDITLDGNRKEVVVLRENDGRAYKNTIDLTKNNMLSSELYYLQEGDIVYVKAKKSATWRSVSTPVSLFLAAITTSVVVIQLIVRN